MAQKFGALMRLWRGQVEQLISEGASPTARDKGGVSALHFAASGGFLSICQ